MTCPKCNSVGCNGDHGCLGSPMVYDGPEEKPMSDVDLIQRWGVRLHGATEPICQRMADGYWTPYQEAAAHIADVRAEIKAHERNAQIHGDTLQMLNDAETQVAQLQSRVDAFESALRIIISNDCRARGVTQDSAIKEVQDELLRTALGGQHD